VRRHARYRIVEFADDSIIQRSWFWWRAYVQHAFGRAGKQDAAEPTAQGFDTCKGCRKLSQNVLEAVGVHESLFAPGDFTERAPVPRCQDILGWSRLWVAEESPFPDSSCTNPEEDIEEGFQVVSEGMCSLPQDLDSHKLHRAGLVACT
jgi:hypothetical protein